MREIKGCSRSEVVLYSEVKSHLKRQVEFLNNLLCFNTQSHSPIEHSLGMIGVPSSYFGSRYFVDFW